MIYGFEMEVNMNDLMIEWQESGDNFVDKLNEMYYAIEEAWRLLGRYAEGLND